ncbi:type IX secretion system membrane protein, PorP/SprF family [Mariniphaga anaerophila]|uniref:Type IX secretion system membrane protein, PorP/SprF family n=1 Tax=Mariniphaga anaerophila TaxID=1484053 RepID=A0A1M4ZN69_9BACT|nr:type IX secretion system membrane protein PorP/SprF [Mariniphaga anaerophila]SHF19489.1 type IX secretion system membrane protein, PorP/SprF family [Mariniphaga anaerophila]
MKFKLNIKKGLGILVLLIVTNVSFGQQDPMYTQYFFTTQTINPAYAGTWNSLGFMALTRQQWTGWNGAPKTYTFSMQAPMKNEKVALGLNVINDKIFKTKQFGIWGDYSYKLKMNATTNLRMGLKAGFTNYSNDLTKYDIIDNTDPAFQGDLDNKFIPNFGVGFFLHNPRYYIGFSIPKMLHSEIQEDNPNNYTLEAEVRHYFLQGGFVFDLNESLKFKPTFMAKATQGAPPQLDLSANFLLMERLWLGAMYRTSDAVGAIVQVILGNSLRVGYSYDYSTTKLQNYHGGTHEIMVSYELRSLKELVTSPRYF